MRGQYLYLGLKEGILDILSSNANSLLSIDTIQLSVSVDGLPLFKSTAVALWPILCSFEHFAPFVVCLFLGKSKPHPVEDFLADFIEEFCILKRTGIEFDSKIITVSIFSFVCDAPARALLKCIKSHTGYYACERCTIKGKWNGRVVYDTQDECHARTDQHFVNVDYEDHQLKRSPLIDCGMSCVHDFSLDYMHLVCLGVVRRMLHFFKQGPKNKPCRLSRAHLSTVSASLLDYRGKMPSEFARQPRGLDELDRWKATEFRQFLLYTGPLVLKHFLHPKVYLHFLTLSIAVSFLLDSDSEKRNTYLQYAQELLQCFVKNCKSVYGDTFNVYNIHNLMHLSDDVEHFRCSLNEVSAFQFENYLQRLKKLIRNAHNTIVQIVKRLQEFRQMDKRFKHKSLKMKISTLAKDSCFLLSNDTYGIIRDVRSDDTFMCDIIHIDKAESLYKKPCDSKLLNIIYIRNFQSAKRNMIERCQIERKAICLSYNDGYVLMPLLHGPEHQK